MIRADKPVSGLIEGRAERNKYPCVVHAAIPPMNYAIIGFPPLHLYIFIFFYSSLFFLSCDL